MKKHLLFGVLTSAALIACNGQFGGELDSGALVCEDTAESELNASSTPFNDGVSVTTLFSEIEGEHALDMAWGETGEAAVSVSPAAGSTLLHLEVELDESSARWVTRGEARDEPSGDDVALVANECKPELRVNALVLARAENGALNESYTVTLKGRSSWLLEGTIDFDEEPHSFEVLPLRENEKASQIELKLAFARGSVSGTLIGNLTGDDGEIAWAAALPLGSFPEGADCDWGVPLNESNETGAQVAELLDTMSLSRVSFASGPTDVSTSLSSRSSLCVAVGPVGDADRPLRVKVLAELNGDDARVDGTWELRASAFIESNGELALHWEGGSSSDFNELLDFSSIYPNRGTEFRREIEFEQDSNGQISGHLSVLEMQIPECIRLGLEPEIIETEDGAFIESCSGIEEVEVEVAEVAGQSAAD